jgi:membrane fusion protein, copper/silver efflux system
VIQFLKEHPWRSSALAALVLLGGAIAVVMYVRRGPSPPDAPRPAARAHDHAAPSPPPVDDHADHALATTPEGFAPVTLEPGQPEAMGLATAEVRERDFVKSIRTVGLVTVDETRTAHVHTRVRGWIEGFHVQFVGQKVRRHQPLVSIFSQEVYAAQLELVSIARSPVKSPELLAAARKRLSLWEVPRSVIDRVERTGEPERTFPILAPRAGVVIAKQAFDGLFVDPSLELYTISDLARVWVLADIYEPDVASVRVGTSARLTIEGRREPVTAQVGFVYPTMDERTRTRKVRFEVANGDTTLMPGAFVTVELEARLGQGLAVPESAVIRTGRRAIVFVVHGLHVEPREIELGMRVGDVFRVERGLVAGERVATGAQFLLDSESRMRATGDTGVGHGGH